MLTRLAHILLTAIDVSPANYWRHKMTIQYEPQFLQIIASESDYQAMDNDPSVVIVMAFRLNDNDPFVVTYLKNDQDLSEALTAQVA